MQFSRLNPKTTLGRSIRTLSGLACLIVAMVAPVTTLAAPAPPVARSAQVSSTSNCPAGVDVELEIASIAPSLRQVGAEVRIQVNDTGAEYTVDVVDPKLRAQKSFFDPARDCKRRARFVAVFVVLTLMPPGFDKPATADAAPDTLPPVNQVPENQPASSVAPDTSSSLTRLPDTRKATGADQQGGRPASEANADLEASGTPRARLKSAVRVEAGLTLQWTPALMQSLSMTGIGAEVRGLFGRGRLAALLSIGYIKRSTFGAEGIHGSMRRMPAVVGAQWRTRLHSIEFSTELGAVAMFERVRGNGFVHSEQSTTVQFGARLGAVVSSAHGRLVPCLGAYANAFPLRQELLAAPQGVVGRTPTIDVGITLGGSYAF